MSAAVFSLFLVGYSLANAADNPKVELVDQSCPPGAIRIAVFSQGRVEVNGREAAVADIPQKLDQLMKYGSVVCVHREHPESAEPHPNMIKVLDMVIARKLPVAFYWDAKFQKRVVFKE